MWPNWVLAPVSNHPFYFLITLNTPSPGLCCSCWGHPASHRELRCAARVPGGVGGALPWADDKVPTGHLRGLLGWVARVRAWAQPEAPNLQEVLVPPLHTGVHLVGGLVPPPSSESCLRPLWAAGWRAGPKPTPSQPRWDSSSAPGWGLNVATACFYNSSLLEHCLVSPVTCGCSRDLVAHRV